MRLSTTIFLILGLSSCSLFESTTPTQTQPDVRDDIGSQADAGSDSDQPDVDQPDSSDDGGTDTSQTEQPNLPTIPVSTNPRVTDGLLWLMDFSEGAGTTVTDIVDPTFTMSLSAGADWIPGRNGIQLDGPGFLESNAPPASFYRTVDEQEHFTLEFWLRAENLDQGGPSRFFTLSLGSGNTNFTFGQSSDKYAVRQRQNISSVFGRSLGYPMLVTPANAVVMVDTHAVITFDGVRSTLYLNGIEEDSVMRLGSVASWDPTYKMRIGNEFIDDRFWAGSIYLTAAYDRVLTLDEIEKNLTAGSGPVQR